MNLAKYILSLLSLVLLLSVVSFAQEEEMTEDEWQAEMTRLGEVKASLLNETDALNSDIDNLNAQKAGLQPYEECLDELYGMVGASSSDVTNFGSAVDELDGKIRRKEGPKKDRQTDLDALKRNKISALSEFFNKVHVQMQKALDTWIDKPLVISYKVVRGDHLWGIAKKKEHYGNAFAWPIIYKTNRDQIKDPDLIYPNQVFKIPPLTENEKSKYEKLRKNYKPAPVQ
ncbi:MAG: LysM peptidoglycan-binding domain-containing protein [Bacteroidetes bacterium]|nr:LysM peptidoglycan-binding domain-containing protein [Bacteroidota bacterium]